MKPLFAAACLSMLVAVGSADADNLPGMGSLSGTVAADQPFQAAKVYARDAAKGVKYMVYTSKGAYKAVNLFPGKYEVVVEKPGFATDAQQITVESGKIATANFKLRPAAVAHSAAGSDPASNDIGLASYDEIYPPGPARRTLENTCIRCHGVNWVPEKPQPEVAWNAVLDLMFNLGDEAVWGVKNGSPLMPAGTITPAERAELLAYLARNFGVDKPIRNVRVDTPIPLDETALASAMWVEYNLTEPKSKGGANRWIQEAYFDRKGNVWLTERTRGAPAILRLDPRTATFKSYPTSDTTWSPHGIVVDPIDADESVWWAGKGVFLTRLNPRTGEAKPYSFDGPGWYGGHTPAFDSKGDLWFSMLPDDKIGHWDRKTDKIRTWKNPTAGGRPYGLLVDQNDKVWYAEFYTCKIARFDPVTEKFTEYTAASAPCTIRRLGLDSKGKIWYGGFSSGKLGKIDPATGKITEYEINRLSEPYDSWVDPFDNVWMGDGGLGGMLIKFDQKTQRMTFYPSPLRSDMPKLAITADGAIWYSNRSIASRGNAPATVGVLYPDMNRMKTLGAFYAVKNGRTVGSGSPRPAPSVQ